MTDANKGADRTPPPPKRKGGLWKWLACGCVVLILLVILAVAAAVFIYYKGFEWMKGRAEQTSGVGYLQGDTPGGQAISQGRFDPAKMQRVLDASEEWPQIKTDLDAGDMVSLNAMARRRGFDNAVEMNLYFSAALAIGSQVLSGSPERAREMYKDIYGTPAVDVVARPDNLEKVRRYLGYP